MRSRDLILPLSAALALAGCAASRDEGGAPAAAPAPAHHDKAAPTIGGAVLDPADTIAGNVARAPNLTTFVKLLRAAGVDATLAGAGPYTVFAPTNDAFTRLAPGTVETLLKPENKASLIKLVDYVLVAGRVTTADLRARVAAGGGTATLETIEGDRLTVTLTGEVLTLTDVNGNKSYVQTGDVSQANGLIQVVNGVLIPNLG
ncbi:MAG: fasciclin domain-containing protein [Sphingomonas sp.]